MVTSPATNKTPHATPPGTHLSRPIRPLMLAFNFPPASTAGVHRTLRFAKYLDDNDCQPSILTRNCDSHAGGESLLAQVPDTVHVYRTGVSPEPPAPTQLPTRGNTNSEKQQKRTWTRFAKDLLRPGWEFITETPDQYLGWARLAVRKAAQLTGDQRFDVVYSTGPPHSTHLAAAKIARRAAIPLVADFRDPWARKPWRKKRNPWGQRLHPRLERQVVSQAARVILNNQASLDDFRKAYPNQPETKFVALPNGYDPDLIPIVKELCREKPNNLVPTICHPGTLYGQRDPTPTLQAIQQLAAAGLQVRFQQVGFCSEKLHPQKIANDLGISKLVGVSPPVSHREALAAMARADVLLVVQPDGPLMVPGKLYEMLLFDHPIVAVCDSIATTDVLQNAGYAWSAASRDVDAIAAAIRSAVEQTTLTEQMELRRLARERYDGRSLTAELAQIFAEVTT